MNQEWLNPQNLEIFCQIIHAKGAALNNCWGFVNGTVRPICRSGQIQSKGYFITGTKKFIHLNFNL